MSLLASLAILSEHTLNSSRLLVNLAILVGSHRSVATEWPRCYSGFMKKKQAPASELVFLVEEAPEGGFTARALDAPIFTEADDEDSLHEAIREAVHCHFDAPEKMPKMIRLHFVYDEVITV